MNVQRKNIFEAVDHYIDDLFAAHDAALEAVLQSTVKAGLPQIQISPGQGKFIYLLAKIARAQRILELGTLAGYSTIWLARALPSDGKLVSLEFDPKHAAVARANVEQAGLGDRVEILEGAALDTLPKLQTRGEAPFDVVFIDADKGNYLAYLEWSLRLTHPGSLILADNVVREGAVLDENSRDGMVRGVRAFNTALASDPRVEAIVLQQVGIKGHDGLAMALVRKPGAS
jgi:predicted O-methyltransferase YrrM